MSVTAVPLQPLSKGTIVKLWLGILLVVLLAVGLAWIGTARQQFQTYPGGIRYRVFQAGEGDPITPADIALARLTTIAPTGETRNPEPGPITAEDLPTALRERFLEMRKGGSYQLRAPVSALLDGQRLPPGSPLRPEDMMEFRFQILEIQRGGVAQQRMQALQQQQAMEQMMREQGGGPGGAPGGVPGRSAPPQSRPGQR